MEIVPPKDFKDARSIPARFNKHDPRLDSFSDAEVVVNLRGCSRVRPPAILWCAVYLLLAKRRGSDCLFQAPNNADATASLRDAGFFRIIREEGVAIEPDGVDIPSSADVILPLTGFDGATAENLTDQVHISLFNSRRGATNTYPVITELFSELVNNAAEHSESNIGAFGFVQFHSSGQERRFTIGVADGGIGIRQSLERNPKHQENYGYEWTAIKKATGELVSGTLSSNRGIGLFSAFDESHLPGRELIIHSGKGILTLSEDSQARTVRANLFPGTLVYVSIPA